MTDQDSTDERGRDADPVPALEGEKEGVADGEAGDAVDAVDAVEGEEEKELTPEEQMARYEESLKDEDWGHQPC